MVPTATQFDVGEVRRSAVDPVLDVVGVAPARRPVAAFGDAAAGARATSARHIAGGTRTGHAGRHRAAPSRPAVITLTMSASQVMRRNVSAGRPPSSQRARPAPAAPARVRPPFQQLDIHVQARDRSIRAAGTLLQTDRRRFTHPHQGVGAALTGGTQVAGTERIHRRLQHVGHDLARLPVEQPVDRDHPVQEVRHVQAPPFVLRLGPLGAPSPSSESVTRTTRFPNSRASTAQPPRSSRPAPARGWRPRVRASRVRHHHRRAGGRSRPSRTPRRSAAADPACGPASPTPTPRRASSGTGVQPRRRAQRVIINVPPLRSSRPTARNTSYSVRSANRPSRSTSTASAAALSSGQGGEVEETK